MANGRSSGPDLLETLSTLGQALMGSGPPPENPVDQAFMQDTIQAIVPGARRSGLMDLIERLNPQTVGGAIPPLNAFGLDRDPTPHTQRGVALHEVGHLLFDDLSPEHPARLETERLLRELGGQPGWRPESEIFAQMFAAGTRRPRGRERPFTTKDRDPNIDLFEELFLSLLNKHKDPRMISRAAQTGARRDATAVRGPR